MTNDRIDKLRKMLEDQPDDTFLLYGLAMEWKKAGDHKQALEGFDRVIQQNSAYCYAYYQKGLVLEDQGDLNAAKTAYEQGIEAARKSGDDHARSELEAALSLLG